MVLAGLVGLGVAAPGWVEDNYREMMQSLGSIRPDMRGVDSIVGGNKGASGAILMLSS